MQPFHSCRALLALFTGQRTDHPLHHFVDVDVVVVALSTDASQALAIIAERSDIWLEIVGHRAVAPQDKEIYRTDLVLVADFLRNEG